MKKMILLAVTAFMIPLTVFAADFNSDLSTLRKKIIPMCAQLQAGKPAETQDKLISDIDSIISGWNRITTTYKSNPPAEYSKDPAWAGYFRDVSDNFKSLQTMVSRTNYKRAMFFCGVNCGIFVNINQVNGIKKVSDVMFMLRKNAKQMMDMINAGNWTGAGHVREHTVEMIEALGTFKVPAGMEKNAFENDLNAVKTAYADFVKTIETKDQAAAKEKLGLFLKTFGPVYSRYL